METTTNQILIAVIVSSVAIGLITLMPQIIKIIELILKKTNYKKLGPSSKIRLIYQLYDAVEQLSATQTGALITLVNKTSLENYRTDGVLIDSNISSGLLISIFNKHAPLHDGAVIIENNKITYVSTYFKITSKSLDARLGARHRAALGISEQTDALTIIVSETNGQISFAKGGALTKVDISEFQEKLVKALN